MTGMPLGFCCLCLQEGELHRSHVLPAFAYRRVRDGAPQHVHASGSTVSYSNTEFKEHLLCGDCEQRFSRIEAEIALVVAEGDVPMPWLSEVAVDPISPSCKVGKSSSTKNDLIARFAISVVWRGAVSSLKTDLGPYEERFRAFLLDDGAAFPDNTRLFVSLITGKTEGVNLQRTASLPKRSRLGGSFQHWFICCGVTFSVIVGKTPPRDFDDACFVRTNGRVFLTGQDEMIERLAPVVSNRRVGKLARERKPGA